LGSKYPYFVFAGSNMDIYPILDIDNK